MNRKLNYYKPSQAKPSQANTLNFFKFYVYLIIIKYYSIYASKLYSNSFLNLLNFVWKKAFIYLNVFINIYQLKIIALTIFYQKYILI